MCPSGLLQRLARQDNLLRVLHLRLRGGTRLLLAVLAAVDFPVEEPRVREHVTHRVSDCVTDTAVTCRINCYSGCAGQRRRMYSVECEISSYYHCQLVTVLLHSDHTFPLSS